MSDVYAAIYRRCSRELVPEPTGVIPRHTPLRDVQAVLFDVYGTLIISASGDVESLAGVRAAAFAEAMKAVHVADAPDPVASVDRWVQTIRETQARMRESGIDYPEVDIVDVWQRTLQSLVDTGAGSDSLLRVDARRFAVEFEARANPVWPMPGAKACIETLAGHGVALGIVSNAQFYVRHMFTALLDAVPEALGFREDLVYFSFEHGHAKPGATLFEMAAQALAREGIPASQVLYVGNDMLNDVHPAAAVGFRTALFAGDARSLRRREDDSRVAGLVADMQISHLGAIAECLRIRPGAGSGSEAEASS